MSNNKYRNSVDLLYFYFTLSTHTHTFTRVLPKNKYRNAVDLFCIYDFSTTTHRHTRHTRHTTFEYFTKELRADFTKELRAEDGTQTSQLEEVLHSLLSGAIDEKLAPLIASLARIEGAIGISKKKEEEGGKGGGRGE